MISLLLLITLLGLTCATYPPYTTGGTYPPYTTAGIQGLGFQTIPYSTGGLGNLGLQTYFPSTYSILGNGYYPSSSYLFNTASFPTVVSHYLYFPGGNPWEPGRNYIDLRVNPYPWYLGYYGGLGTRYGSNTFPGSYGTFSSSLGYPPGFGGFFSNGLTGFQLDPSFSTGTGNLGFGNIGFPVYGPGGYYPTGNLGEHIHRKKIY